MNVIQQGAWAVAVLAAINSTPEGAQHLKEAVLIVERGSGETAPAQALALLSWMRGDEPADAYEAGDSAHDYAGFLLAEWRIFGPEGE